MEPDRTENEDDEVVWEAAVELERLQEDVVGLAVTRGRKPIDDVKGTDEETTKPEEQAKRHTAPENQPAFNYESKAVDPQAANRMFKRITNVAVPDVTVNDLVTLSNERS